MSKQFIPPEGEGIGIELRFSAGLCTEQDFLADAWRRLANISAIVKPVPVPLSELRKSEWCEQFEQLMRNRLLVGYYRYGTLKLKKPHNWIDRAKKQLDRYIKTGNTEYLVDVANFMMAEFVQGSHPNKHFKAMDRI